MKWYGVIAVYMRFIAALITMCAIDLYLITDVIDYKQRKLDTTVYYVDSIVSFGLIGVAALLYIISGIVQCQMKIPICDGCCCCSSSKICQQGQILQGLRYNKRVTPVRLIFYRIFSFFFTISAGIFFISSMLVADVNTIIISVAVGNIALIVQFMIKIEIDFKVFAVAGGVAQEDENTYLLKELSEIIQNKTAERERRHSYVG
ncbi:Hypothetical_protein [Hexamita inflata]|uniref:Hypothetical_protein n=1 Tax=Hexamita inflata TaxID=28002 RepID=A0AA86UMJ1_9EUKA|nr:Hypothetical protein HINF_LOCUS48869 [Hexamita inflata]